MSQVVIWAALVLLVAAVVLFVVLRSRRARGGRAPGVRSVGSRPAAVRVLSRSRLAERLESAWRSARDNERAWRRLEDELVAADLGVAASRRLIARAKEAGGDGFADVRAAMRTELLRCLEDHDRALALDGAPAIVVMVGINGAGKTTTVAKLASQLAAAGRTPLLAAADTFRPAADTQLRVWADRLGVQLVSGPPGGDPAAVAYDGLAAARARGADVLLVDTAGRLHTSHNLMGELAKIIRVLGRDGDTVSETLLVIDGGTGQSGLAQAASFAELGATGVILTKMDGTAKAGLVLQIESDLALPVKMIGIGEGAGDLAPFDAAAFVDGLLGPA